MPKRHIVLFCVFVVCLSLGIMLPNMGYASELPIGTIIDSVLATDIRAYVNGSEIPSMNIRGYTAIVVEDLSNYGFDVSWNPEKRRLVIKEAPNKPINPLPNPASSGLAVGTKIKDVLYTDIKAFWGETELPSFNIDGYTAIRINDLTKWGDVIWDPEKREVSFTSTIRRQVALEKTQYPGHSFNIWQTDIREFRIVFRDNSMYYGEKKIGFSQNGKPMLALSFFADKLGYSLNYSKQSQYFLVENRVYGVQVKPDNVYANILWDKGFHETLELFAQPIVEKGELYLQ
ncbi:MAG: hypothetical protein ACOY9Y_01025 [Bacillota bacterium]